eukprot:747084-Hanusia_phi.AAC.3
MLRGGTWRVQRTGERSLIGCRRRGWSGVCEHFSLQVDEGREGGSSRAGLAGVGDKKAGRRWQQPRGIAGWPGWGGSFYYSSHHSPKEAAGNRLPQLTLLANQGQ